MTIKANMKTSRGGGKLYKLEAPGDEISVPGVGKFEYVCNKVGTGAVAGIPGGSETTGGSYVCGNKEITVSQGTFNGKYGIDITVIKKGKSPTEYAEMFGDKLRSGKERFHEVMAKHKPHLKSGSGEIRRVTTERDSVYTYLPDGKTMRYKEVADKYSAPQDVIVFVPDYEWVKNNAPEKGSPQRFCDKYGCDEAQYQNLLLSYIHDDDKACYVVNKNNKELLSNREVAETEGEVYLLFVDRSELRPKKSFHIPVAKKPVIGFSAYDMRNFTQSGTSLVERHLGRKVTRIEYTSNYDNLKAQFAKITKPGVKKLKGKTRPKSAPFSGV
ncbi:MAG: hypothetical protein U9Q92_01085 [archaeon]|nr:hypothetical protein [archaeon]